MREVNTVGGPTTDIHDLQLLPNGNYLVGGQVIKHHVDTSAYGGSSDADIMGFEIQEVTPGGQLVWKWDSLDHIGLAQTPMTLLEPGRPTAPALRHPALELARAGGQQPPPAVLPQPRCRL